MRVDIPQAALEVEDHGEGPPVLLLHGFPLSSEVFAPIRPSVELWARFVTPDLRGFGLSDKPDGGYSMDELADDVIAVADALGLSSFVLGGHSMGGYVALRVAAKAVGRITGLVLLDTRAEPDSPEARQRRHAAVEAIRGGGRGRFLEDFLPALVGPSSRKRGARFVEELWSQASAVPDHVLVACLEGMARRPDSRPLLKSLDVPALVIVGEEDEVTPRSAAAELVEALPQGELVVVPGAGHVPTLERPIATGDAIAGFLRRQGAR